MWTLVVLTAPTVILMWDQGENPRDSSLRTNSCSYLQLVRVLQGVREKERERGREEGREGKGRGRGERFILRNWFMGLWGLASPKSTGWAGRLETQGRDDSAARV